MIDKDTMFYHINYNSKSIHFILNPDIVDILICDMFFHSDDHDGIIQMMIKSLFHQFEDKYRITISNSMQFRLIVTQIARGTSFRQIIDIINDTKVIIDT